MLIIELLKAVLFGIVEGITEWLPISSTGHMILLNEFLSLDVSPAFWELFEVVIQLGAILAVIVLFFRKLNPLSPSKEAKEKAATWRLWGLVIIAVLPSAVIGLLLDDWLNEHFYNYVTVAAALIVYGIAFIVIERLRKDTAPRVETVEQLTVRDALTVGIFQVLAVIPGTSRSGSTILGGMLFGLSRTAAAEFSFYLAIPTMAGASLLKGVKFFLDGNTLGGKEWALLGVGCLVAFLVSLCVIRYLMDYVRRHSFAAFGIYRIILGILVLGYFLLR
ncbi:MAG: undecaprenyl-diphosphate phosphatase [Ruminococcaceae bacterium]|nr:undecaprenyl-diphosphate phosphatase [Oscillospiraceae bacterium]